MKLGTYTANGDGFIPSVKVFAPVQALLFDVRRVGVENFSASSFNQLAARVNITLQNSKDGSNTPIVPYISLRKLAEIATFNEGCVLMDSAKMLLPVMLNPAGNLSVDNDKYLDIEIHDLAADQQVTIYAECNDKMSDFVTKYMKMTCPAGVARSEFMVKESDLVCFPSDGYDSIRLTYKGGLVSDRTIRELEYDMAKNNDITAYGRDSSTGGVNLNIETGNSNNPADFAGVYANASLQLIMSYGKNFVLNLINVDKIEILRDSDSSQSFEFILGDLVK